MSPSIDFDQGILSAAAGKNAHWFGVSQQLKGRMLAETRDHENPAVTRGDPEILSIKSLPVSRIANKGRCEINKI
jgi:hypothetical protein